MAEGEAYHVPGKQRGQPIAAQDVEGLAAGLLAEVIKADLSMHSAQIDAWQFFKDSKPRGDHINQDIYDGFADSRYLYMDEVQLTVCLKPVKRHVLARLWQWFGYLFGTFQPVQLGQGRYKLCARNDKHALKLHLTVKRNKKGKHVVDHQVEEHLNTG